MRSLLITPCLLLLAFLFFTACKKTTTTSGEPAFTPGMDIYIAGSTGGKAVYWKNGEPVILNDTGFATSITVSGTDVFVAGQVGGLVRISAAYWKNGEQFTLPHSRFSTATGIGVLGSDVYVTGYVNGDKDTVTYWKNGQRFNFLPVTSGSANGIAFSGTDVFAVGRVYTPLGSDTAVIWKNGIRDRWVSISNYASLNAIVFSGADMYFGGSSGGDAFCMKNTEFPWLEKRNAAVTGIAVAGADTYVSGYYYTNGNRTAAYWKNGVLTTLSDKYVSSWASGIAVAGNDVYVVGTIYDTKTFPVYWKNGIMKALAGNGYANAVVVGK
jgi:hypothetical protein